MIASKSITIFEKLTIMLLILFPVLNVYGSNGWSYAAILALFLGVIAYIVNKKCKIKSLPMWLSFYFLYWGVALSFTLQMLPLFVIQVLISYVLFYGTFNIEYFIQQYKRIAILFILFFFIQVIVYNTSNMHISGIIPGVPLNIDDLDAFYRVMENSNRCYSVFSEPAHFVQFLLPLLVLELFYDKAKYHFYFAGLITVVLLLLQSGTALLCLIPVFVYLIPLLKNKINNNFYSLFPILVVAVIAFCGFYYYINSDIGYALGERSGELSMQYSTGENVSGFLRIWRGYYVYSDYSTIEKIFGNTNTADLNAHIKNSGMSMGILNETYFNAVQNILLRTGIIGLVIIIAVFVNLYKGNYTCGKCMIMVLVCMMFLSSIYFSITMLTFILIADTIKKEQLGKK